MLKNTHVIFPIIFSTDLAETTDKMAKNVAALILSETYIFNLHLNLHS